MSDSNTSIVGALNWIAHNPQATGYVVCFIFAVFVFMMTWFLRRLGAAEKDVKSLRGFVSSGTVFSIAAEALAGERSAAVGMVTAAGIDENAPIARRFAQYCEGLLLDDVTDTKFRTARSASEVFEPDAIIRETMNLRLIQAIPNILVGLGLLFTFTGLTVALYFASQGSTATNVMQTQDSIKSLLDAATFKFASSLAALVLSICFLVTERIALRNFQDNVLLLVTSLDVAFPPISTEELMRSMISETKRQSEELHDFGKSIAFTLTDSLNSTLGVTITDTFASLDKTIQTVGETMHKANQKVLQTIVNGFISELQKHTQESVSQILSASADFTKSVSAQAVSVNESVSSLSALAQHVAAEARNGLSLLESALGDLRVTVDHNNSAAVTLSKAAAPLKAVASSTATLLTDLGKAYETASNSVIKLSEAAESFESMITRGVEFNRAGQEMSVKMLADSSELYRDRMLEVSNSLKNDFGSITGDIERLADALSDSSQIALRDGAALMAENGRHIERLEKQMSTLSEALSQASGSIAMAAATR